jgi:hypothetical protein
MRPCLECLIPAWKDRITRVALPPIAPPDDLPKATSARLQAVAHGELTAAEAAEPSKLVAVHVQAFETAKTELGLAHNESRSWHGWHRHVSLARLAFAMLARVRRLANGPLPRTTLIAKLAGAVVHPSACDFRRFRTRSNTPVLRRRQNWLFACHSATVVCSFVKRLQGVASLLQISGPPKSLQPERTDLLRPDYRSCQNDRSPFH